MDTAHTPQDTPIHLTHDPVRADTYHPVTKHTIASTGRWSEDQAQVESQTMPELGDHYTAGSGPSEMLTSTHYCGKEFHLPYDESSIEAESQLHPGVGVGGEELRGDLQATTGDVDEGWPT